MRISDVLLRLIGARDPNCPNEADVLAYSENRLSTRSRAQAERHFADCHDCRQALAFLGRGAEEAAAQLTEEAVSAQTGRVLAYIQRDERNRSKPAQKARSAAGFYISYPRLASVGLVICAIAIAGVFMFTGGQSPADAGMAALRRGLKYERRTEARISGGLAQSRYTGATRSDDRNDDDLHFGNAENKVKAEADVEARLVWARVYLARANREDAKRALAILDQLMKSGVETPVTLNDTGVAQFQLDNYDDAIVSFTKALAKSPRYDEALFNRALAEGRAHRDAEARQDWQQFINQSPNDDWKSEALSHLKQLGAEKDN
jgi:tetratricopeptide (TPR) repeat protein